MAIASVKGTVNRIQRLGLTAAVVVLAVLVLWGLYRFQFHENSSGVESFNRPLATKIDDLTSPITRQALHALTAARLLPRPYLWGLADVVRSGIEGRAYILYVLASTTSIAHHFTSFREFSWSSSHWVYSLYRPLARCYCYQGRYRT